MLQDKMLKPLELDFNGKAREYFRIWIVNVLLTILTIGVYSAWAKVRTKQYFYGNTILDGSPFEYNASPVAILKGRLVVAAILIIYFAVSSFYPAVEPIFILVFFGFLPWLIMRSMMFNARYSNYRNLNFTFNNNLRDSVKTFIGLAILIPLTLGLIYPFYMHAIQQYRVDNHNFGQLAFRLKSIVGRFYKIYLLAGLIFIGIIVLFYFFGLKDLTNAMVSASSEDPEAAPELPANAGNIILIMTLIYLVAYFFVYAFIQAKVFNAVWENTTLTKVGGTAITAPRVPLVAFNADITPLKLFYIYVTNTLAIVASLGLLIPWAKIRMARYRISHVDVSAIADLKTISAAERDKEGAIGSEMGDILDIDIGI